MCKPLIIQSDATVMFNIDSECFQEVREFLLKFAVAEKTPEHIHIYKIDTVSLWNASVLWYDKNYIIDWLNKYSQFPIPKNIENFIENQLEKYWKIKFLKSEKEWFFILKFEDKNILSEFKKVQKFYDYVWERKSQNEFFVKKEYRWKLKAFFIDFSYPVEDLIWYEQWGKKTFQLKWDWKFRDYQQEAIDSFFGSWVIVLACGWGKTIVSIWVMHKEQTKTLIITTTANAVYQFKKELLDKTTLTEDDIWLFVWSTKEIKDITITTYAMLTYKNKKSKKIENMDLIEKNNLLPAPVFSFSASLQAKKRLGLTATLVREDKAEGKIFQLIWPKIYDKPWKELECSGFIAQVKCLEIRTNFSPEDLGKYYNAETKKQRFKIASINSWKIKVLEKLLNKHKKDKILIIWEYIEQLESIHKKTWIDIITWKLNPKKREELLNKFRQWQINALILSRVANFAIDLPDANVLIQVSWLFGSRQEEAQRLGRILRPKKWLNQATFYTIVTDDSVEVEYVEKRQMFLIEQWYEYDILFE